MWDFSRLQHSAALQSLSLSWQHSLEAAQPPPTAALSARQSGRCLDPASTLSCNQLSHSQDRDSFNISLSPSYIYFSFISQFQYNNDSSREFYVFPCLLFSVCLYQLPEVQFSDLVCTLHSPPVSAVHPSRASPGLSWLLSLVPTLTSFSCIITLYITTQSQNCSQVLVQRQGGNQFRF